MAILGALPPLASPHETPLMNARRLVVPPCLLVVALAAAVAWAADEFPEVYNNDSLVDAEPMPADEAARSLQVPAGFHVGVFASEPDVQNPIDMAWDARGRIWIAENYTYADRTQKFDLSLRDRVVVFADTDGDGASDERTVFTDGVQMLTSVEVGRGGVWLMCPPRLLFIPDRDHDATPDGRAEVVLDGFEVATQNHHNFANGLRFGPDGWLYGRCGGSCPGRVGPPGTPDDERVALEGGIWRYHPSQRRFEVLCHGTTNPWGHDWNGAGDGFFINTVNGHLWQIIPGAHYVRPFTLDPNPHVYELIDMHADHWHFDTTGVWQDSRDGAANAFGGGHAHCGVMIYLGDQWPATYRDRLFTWNLHGRRANQEVLERRGSGYVGRHGDDVLRAADPFFRGMDLSYGPDGAVYAIDWSDTGECHEHTGVHRTSGRIFRIAHQANDRPRGPVDLYAQSNVELAALMRHENEWFARQARLVLAERSETGDSGEKVSAAEETLRKLVRGAEETVAYRALVTLHAMGRADEKLLRELLQSRHESLRAWAVRLIADAWPIDDVMGPTKAPSDVAERVAAAADVWLPALIETARDETSAAVRLALASTLQRLPVERRIELAAELVAHAEDADDHNLPLLVWYGLAPAARILPIELAELAVASRWPTTQRLAARRLAEEIERRPAAFARLLDGVLNSREAAARRNLLAGIAAGLKGWSQAKAPSNWEAVVASRAIQSDAESAAIVRDLSVLFGDGRALEEVRRIVLDDAAEIGLRRSALETLVERGDADVAEICIPLLDDPRLNVPAARGVAKRSDPAAARALIENYGRFRAPQRPKVVSILVSRASFAGELLDAIDAGSISPDALSAFDVRQIRSLGDDSLSRRIAAAWGEVRETSTEKRERIAELKRRLTPEVLAAADLSRGRALFRQSCAKCHRLLGEGEAIGPDLTGGDRSNLDYLLENLIDPSGVVSKDFRMTIVELTDGRVLNGLVVSRNDATLTLQTQTDQLVVGLAEVAAEHLTDQSPMPEGQLDNLSEDEARDLVAYLASPTQAPAPEATP